MALGTAVLEVRVVDCEPLPAILDAVGDLAKAVAAYFELIGVDVNDPDAGVAERPLCDALLNFQAVVDAAGVGGGSR